MENIIKILEALGTKTETPPTLFGGFHLAFIGGVVLLVILTAVLLRNLSERAVRIICLALWGVIVLFEVYKQVYYTFTPVGGEIVTQYQWYQFPFQLCSSPHYVLPFVALLPNGKVRDAMISFMIAFSAFGGLVVFIYPGVVFSSTVGLNYQTMIHHGVQRLAAALLAAKYRERLNIRFFFKGAIVFGGLLSVAMILNWVLPIAFAGCDPTAFSMFYISPTQSYCPLPILEIIFREMPYIVFLAIYVVGFMAAALAIFYAGKGIASLGNKIGVRIMKKRTAGDEA